MRLIRLLPRFFGFYHQGRRLKNSEAVYPFYRASTISFDTFNYHFAASNYSAIQRKEPDKIMSDTEAEDKTKEGSSNPLRTTKVLDTQVGGHRYGNNGQKMGMLDCGNGIVLKALQTPPRGERELNLYQTTFAPECRDKDLLELRNFLPLYYGTEIVDNATFLVMSNLAHSFSKPNILDVKMGRVTYDPEATLQKREQEKAKYPPCRELGFQLTGMMMHDPASGNAEHFTKQFCRSVTAETMLTQGLGRFFGLQNGRLRKDVLTVLLRKLRRIEEWFLVQQTFAFYSSSLLIVYSSIDHGQGSAISIPKTQEHRNDAHASQQVSAGEKLENSKSGSTGSSVDKNSSQPASDRTSQRPGQKRAHSQNTCAEHGETESSSNPTKQARICEDDVSSCQTALKNTVAESPETESNPSSGQADSCADSAEGFQTGQNTIAECSKTEPSFNPTQTKTCKNSAESCQTAPKTVTVGSETQSNPHLKQAKTCSDRTQSCQKEKSESLRTCKSDQPIVEVRMIDFAHVFPSSSRDDNYLFGLQKLIRFVEQLLKM